MNFSSNSAGSSNTGQLPFSNTNVIFYATNASSGNVATTLGQDFAIQSLTVDGTSLGAESQPVSIAGNTLTIEGDGGDDGITMGPGAGPLTINSALVLGGTETWTNNSSSPLSISGSSITTAYPLTFAGSGNTIISAPLDTSYLPQLVVIDEQLVTIHGLYLDGPGTVTLAGNQDINSDAYVTAGALDITGSVSISTVYLAGGAGEPRGRRNGGQRRFPYGWV